MTDRSRVLIHEATFDQAKVDRAKALIDAAYEEHKPALVFTLLSGGHDSMSATGVGQEWAAERGLKVPVAFVNTGTGIEDRHTVDTGIKSTRRHVIDWVQSNEWSLIELHPPRSYESLVMEHGFPGPGMHDRYAYVRLKERCFRTLARLAPDDRPVMFISGVREQESERRTEHVEKVQVTPSTLWVAPIWDWSELDTGRFIAAQGWPRNEVKDAIHISGECLCGAMARKGERVDLGQWFPLKLAEIEALEDRAEAAGLRAHRWGVRPPKVAREQMRAFLAPSDGTFPMLCANCPGDAEESEAA